MVELFENIRKIYSFSAPRAELAGCIEFFSESSGEETEQHIGNSPFSVKMFPSWTPTFWFNLGPPYLLQTDTRRVLVAAAEDILVARSETVERINQPEDHIFTVKLFPGALETMFGISQAAVGNRIVNLSTILPKELLHGMHMSGTYGDRVALLEFFFLQRLANNKRNHYIDFISNTISCVQNGDLRYNVEDIAERRFTTSRSINRYFNRVLGIGPKEYFSMLRVRSALPEYVRDKKAFDPDNFGYYDMSHFYREVVRHTGIKPSGSRLSDFY